MKKNFLGKVLMMASFAAILGGFSSCQDYSEEVRSDVLNKLETQNTTLENALAAQKQALEAKLAELQAAQEACKAECAEKMSQLDAKWSQELAAQVALLKAEDAKIAGQIDAINSAISSINGEIDNINGEISGIKDVIGNVEELGGKTVVEQIVALNKIAAAVNDTIVAWGPRLTAVEKEAAEAYAQASVNKEAIENLDSIAEAHQQQIEGLTQALKDSVAAIKEQAEKNLKAAYDYADTQVALMKDSLRDEISDSISNLRTDLMDSLSNVRIEMLDSLSQLSEVMALTDSLLEDRLDSVEARVGRLETQVAKNTKDIENLTGALKKLVTSVVLQGTKNPVMGSIATPFNTRSNILAAYYGSVDAEGLEFPTARPRYFVDAANVQLTAKDIEMLGVGSVVSKSAGEVLLGDEGNAGTLYMTINPNTVDFTGLNVSLVNSQDEFSGAELSGLAPSNEVLSFGYTRAAKNGFYEAKATITPATLSDVKLSLNFNEIKEVAKDIVNGGSVDVNKVASVVSDAMSAFVMDANGVKVSWTDELCDEEHSTYSQYGVAVTAVKPLSMAFGKDFNYTKVPGFDRIESLIGKVAAKAKATLNKADKLLNYDLVEVKEFIIPEAPVVDSIEVVVNIPGQTVKDGFGNDIWVDGYNDTIKVSVQEVVDELYADLADSFDDVNDMMKQLKKMMADANKVLEEAKNLKADALNSVDKIQTKLVSFLNKFNNKFCSLINSTNKVLRPVLFVSTEGGFHKLSQAKNNPSVITGKTLDFVATSYTMDYIAPAYKKMVGVTNVFKGSASAQAGDAECVAALNKVNEQGSVAKVLEGDVFKVNATLEAGYIYEVVYTAVDFYGKVDAKKFYVTVK
ncbi:MAG: hypothetical protein IKW22_06525 [Bacteroidaceae bacterium]|nr:hypothetical protein [Bacteroidaceae bacterium]